VLSRRNQDIELLESRVRSLLKDNQDLKDKCSSITIDKNRAIENYQLLCQMKERSSLVNEESEAQRRDSTKYLESKLEQLQKNFEVIEALNHMKDKELTNVTKERDTLEKEFNELKSEFEQNDRVIISTKNELKDLKETYNSLKEDYDLKLEYLQNRSKSPDLAERKSSFSQSFTLTKDLKGSSTDFASIFNERASLYSKFQKASLATIEEKGETYDEDKETVIVKNPSIFKKQEQKLEKKEFAEDNKKNDKIVDDGLKVKEELKENEKNFDFNREIEENKRNVEYNKTIYGEIGKTENDESSEKTEIKKKDQIQTIVKNPIEKTSIIEENPIPKKSANPFFEKIDTQNPSSSLQSQNIQNLPSSQQEPKNPSNFKELDQKSKETQNKNIAKTDPEYRFLQFDEARYI